MWYNVRSRSGSTHSPLQRNRQARNEQMTTTFGRSLRTFACVSCLWLLSPAIVRRFRRLFGAPRTRNNVSCQPDKCEMVVRNEESKTLPSKDRKRTRAMSRNYVTDHGPIILEFTYGVPAPLQSPGCEFPQAESRPPPPSLPLFSPWLYAFVSHIACPVSSPPCTPIFLSFT